MTKEEYDLELSQRQTDHLNEVERRRNIQYFKIYYQNWTPCLHDSCAECHGTGIKLDGSFCIHWISCTCPKCNPSYSTGHLVSCSNDEYAVGSEIDGLKIDKHFNGFTYNAQG